MSRIRLKVLTLNCWALPTDYFPFPCQLKNERIAAIQKELASGKYDVVLLQEIWQQSDFEKLVNGTLSVLKYSHYFHSGMIGSGVCILSKYPIVETFQRRFSLNGYPHKIWHGDWFGGKVVGLAQVLVDDFKVNIYAAHTHADYGDCAEYLAQRTLQAYELSQFVKHTSQGCDAVIVGGDLNMTPNELAFKLVLANANLLDCWTSQTYKVENEADGHTSNLKDILGDSHKQSKRIDYLLFRNNTGFDMVCEKSNVCLGKIPGENYSFSDHMGVEATFQIRRNITGFASEGDRDNLHMHIPEAQKIIQDGTDRVYSSRRLYWLLAVACLLLLVMCADLGAPFGINAVLALCRTAITLCAGYALVNAIVLSSVELNGLLSTSKELEKLAKTLKQQ